MPYRTMLGTLTYSGTDVDRLIKTCRQQTAALAAIRDLLTNQTITAADFMAIMMECECELGINPNEDWYEFERSEIYIKFAKGEISEGAAAYYLNTDRVQARFEMEQHFGSYWRDLSGLSHAALNELYNANLAPTQYPERAVNHEVLFELVGSGVVVDLGEGLYAIKPEYRPKNAPAYTLKGHLIFESQAPAAGRDEEE